MLNILSCLSTTIVAWFLSVKMEGEKFKPKKEGVILGGTLAIFCALSIITKWNIYLLESNISVIEICAIFSLCAIPMAISDFQNKQLPWFLTFNFWFWTIYLIGAVSGYNYFLVLALFLLITFITLIVTSKINIGFADIYTIILVLMLLIGFKNYVVFVSYLVAIAIIGIVLQIIRMRDPIMKVSLKRIPALPLYIGAFPVAMAVLCLYFL